MKITPQTLPQVPKIRDLAVSPDGTVLSLVVEVLDGPRFRRGLFQVAAGGSAEPKEVDLGGLEISEPGYLADGSLLFCSSPPAPSSVESEARAVYLLSPGSGSPRCLLTVPGGIDTMDVAPSGWVLLRAWVDPKATDLAEDAAIAAVRSEAAADAVLFEELETRAGGRLLGPRLPRLLRFAVDAPDILTDLTPSCGSALVGSHQAISSDGEKVVTSWRRVAPSGFRDHSLEMIDASGQRTIARGGQFTLPTFSPDGRFVVCEKLNVGTPARAERMSLWLVDLEKDDGFDLTGEFPLWPEVPFWAPDSHFVYFVADDRGHSPIFRVSIETQEIEKVADGAFTCASAAPSGDAVFGVRHSYSDVPRLVRVDTSAPMNARITRLPGFGDEVELNGTASEMTCRTKDDFEIHSHLVLPAGASAEAPVPLVLWAHGQTRGWNAQNFWLQCPYVLVEHGYAVLMVNPSRSTGYGQAFMQRGWSDWTHIPDDLLAAFDEAVKRPDIDGDNVAAMGHSVGGHLVSWLAGRSQRFKAIVDLAGIWSWELLQGVMTHPTMWEEEFGDPYENPQAWARNSPRQDLEHISTPMLIIYGMKDDSVAISQALQLWTDLKRHDVPAKFLLLPEEDHPLSGKPSDVVIYHETVLAFLDHHVLGSPWVQPALLG